MATAAPIFIDAVRSIVELILGVFALVVEGVALVHCLTQRSDAFPAIGTLPKGAWIAILALCMVLTTLLGFGVLSIFGLIGIAAALIYLLDVRVGLRDLTDGKGFW
jgi:type III secretory pathway component EscU